MGLFQNLLETYAHCSEAVGLAPIDADGNANEKKTLLPICHMTFKSEIHVTIDQAGRFIRASRDGRPTTIIIPCTEGSTGRSSGIAAHPLCDQLDYVGGIHEAKTAAYLEGLAAWKDAHTTLAAIYTYVAGKTCIQDLMQQQIFKESEFAAQKDQAGGQAPDFEKIRKMGVRFTVLTDIDTVNVWECKALREAWITHITGSSAPEKVAFDYMSGEPVGIVAAQHPKNIHALTGNAKLLSCNDTSGFTFRGRFAVQDDAVLVDYVQSQKMHQMLRWLIVNCGYAIDSQVIVSWAVDDQPEVKARAQDNSYALFGDMVSIKTDTESLIETQGAVNTEYAQKLRLLLQGYGRAEAIKKHARKICIAVFDAATTGRMGLVFYQELPEDDYLESIVNWHTDTSYYLTCWTRMRDADGREKSVPVRYIGAPSYDEILFAVYGKSHGDKAYNTLKKKIHKLLLECIFGNFTFPESMVKMAANRTSQPMSFADVKWENEENEWTRALNITCALIRKEYKQKTGEEIPLTLDELQKDRNYLYGRWLAVADKVEEAALRRQGKQKERATNAMRLTSSYSVKPFTTKLTISQQLHPYTMQINLLYKNFFLPIITEIDEKLQEFTDSNEPLSPLYLLGYSAQYRALSKNDNNKSMEGTDDGNVAE
ncbi:MAG: type I-C CRISPR-associated protein Cas8c/Csd1 [Oscillospiraceae bacterium]|jgi:CRISPR-associated protein Csd1